MDSEKWFVTYSTRTIRFQRRFVYNTTQRFACAILDKYRKNIGYPQYMHRLIRRYLREENPPKAPRIITPSSKAAVAAADLNLV